MRNLLIFLLSFWRAQGLTPPPVMVGEIGGTAEEEASEFIKAHVSKNVRSQSQDRFHPEHQDGWASPDTFIAGVLSDGRS